MDDQTTRLLCSAWGLRDVWLEPLPAGHANRTYRVHGGPTACVARVSWPGKTRAQVDRESHVIALARGALNGVAVPSVMPTKQGADHVRTAQGRWVHVFESIAGVAGGAINRDRVEQAMQALAALHAALSPTPAQAQTARDDALDWLTARHRRVLARPAPSLASISTASYEAMLGSIGAHLAAAQAWPCGPAQWLHGDYHAGNLIFVGDALRGIVDFDEVGRGATCLEAAFAAFALSRDAERDDSFRFDASRWRDAVTAYAGAVPAADVHWWIARQDALTKLFCVDQVLIHLEAAQRGLWAPGPGMGFLGCWKELQLPL